MIDREQAIDTAAEAEFRSDRKDAYTWQRFTERAPVAAAEIRRHAAVAVDAILALPDPVYEAAREVIQASEKLEVTEGYRFVPGDVMDRLRATLADEPSLSREGVLRTMIAALADERGPDEHPEEYGTPQPPHLHDDGTPRALVPITDEMVERAAKEMYEAWTGLPWEYPDTPGETLDQKQKAARTVAMQTLDAALNGGES